MSDQQPSSPVNLFKMHAPASVSGQNSSSELNSGNPADSAFSRELSKASERSAERTSQQRTDSPTPRSESPKHPFGRSKNENETRTTQKPTDQSEGSQRSDQRSTEASAQTSENTSVVNEQPSKNLPQKASKTPEQQTAETQSNVLLEKAVLNTEQVKEQALQSAGAQSTPLDVELPAEELVLPSNIEPAVPNVVSAAENVISDIQSTDPVNDTDAVDGETAIAEVQTEVKEQNSEAVATNNISLSSSQPMEGDEVDVEKPSVQRLTVGEQLTPRQLANRQNHLFNKVATRPPVSAETGQQSIAVDVNGVEAGNETSRTTTVAANAAASLGATTNGKNIQSAADRPRANEGVSAKPSLTQAIVGDSSAEQASGNGTSADDIEAAADLTTKLAARQADQQTNLNNLVQNRQASQQQVQNFNVITAATTGEPTERSTQSTDNMFLSLPGGIVTAPVVQRSDAGNSQIINAPINMPILQNDADKAMAGNIRWMVNEGVKNAVVNVTPSGMGPISVSIGIEKDQMNISIVAMQGSTREALDSMLPRLREQFAAQGQDNVRVDISDGRAEHSDRGYGQQFTGEQNGSEQENRGGLSKTESDGIEEQSSSELALADNRSQGLFDINENGKIRSRYDAYV